MKLFFAIFGSFVAFTVLIVGLLYLASKSYVSKAKKIMEEFDK